MMLRSALNALTRLHSRTAFLKRLGADYSMFSPCRITPSNFFRFLRGPEYTTIRGVEFIIPIDSMLGQVTQFLAFSGIPDEGVYSLRFGTGVTDPIPFDAGPNQVEAYVRSLGGLENTSVTYTDSEEFLGFNFVFPGEQTPFELGEVVDSTLMEDDVALTGVFTAGYTPWTDKLKKGDRILDGSSLWSVDEIMVMHDVGAEPMAYRVRCD